MSFRLLLYKLISFHSAVNTHMCVCVGWWNFMSVSIQPPLSPAPSSLLFVHFFLSVFVCVGFFLACVDCSTTYLKFYIKMLLLLREVDCCTGTYIYCKRMHRSFDRSITFVQMEIWPILTSNSAQQTYISSTLSLIMFRWKCTHTNTCIHLTNKETWQCTRVQHRIKCR